MSAGNLTVPMKLDRDVAIKVLPGSLAGDPDRIARFQREAEVITALKQRLVGAWLV